MSSSVCTQGVNLLRLNFVLVALEFLIARGVVSAEVLNRASDKTSDKAATRDLHQVTVCVRNLPLTYAIRIPPCSPATRTRSAITLGMMADLPV